MRQVQLLAKGNTARLEVCRVFFGKDVFALAVDQAEAVEVLSVEHNFLGGGKRAAQILLEPVGNHDHIALAEHGDASVGRQAHGIDADNRRIQGQVVLGYGVVSQLFGIKACGAGNFVETCLVVDFPRNTAFDVAFGITTPDDVAVVGINGKTLGLNRRGGGTPCIRENLNLRQTDDPARNLQALEFDGRVVDGNLARCGQCADIFAAAFGCIPVFIKRSAVFDDFGRAV